MKKISILTISIMAIIFMFTTISLACECEDNGIHLTKLNSGDSIVSFDSVGDGGLAPDDYVISNPMKFHQKDIIFRALYKKYSENGACDKWATSGGAD